MNRSSETRLLAGRVLGHYRLLSPLDQRSAIQVWLGEHVHLHVPVALKILRRDGLDEDELKHHEMRLHNEARILADLHHPHIVGYRDYEVSRHFWYIVMQYAAGGSVASHHADNRKLPLSLIRFYTWQVGHSLAALHQRGFIHRDVKPGNILLLHSRHALLADFGLAMRDPALVQQPKSSTGGTVAYMPPEQYYGRPCAASDQYGLATCVYEWLTGRRPFSGETAQMMRRRERFDPLPASRFRPELPAAVDEILLTALQSEPSKRYASVLDFARALVTATRGLQSPLAEKQEQVSRVHLSVPTSLEERLPSTMPPLSSSGQKRFSLLSLLPGSRG